MTPNYCQHGLERLDLHMTASVAGVVKEFFKENGKIEKISVMK